MSLFEQTTHTIDLNKPFGNCGFWTAWLVYCKHLAKKGADNLSKGVIVGVKEMEAIVGAIEKTVDEEQRTLRVELYTELKNFAELSKATFTIEIVGA